MNARAVRLIPPLETYPGMVAFAQKLPGKVLLLAGFTALLSRLSQSWLLVTPFLVLAAFIPSAHRRTLVAAGTLVVAFVLPLRAGGGLNALAGPGLVFLFGAGMYLAARRFSRSPLFARPVLLLLGLAAAYLIIVGARPGLFPAGGLAWSVAGAVCQYQWFIGYALLDRMAQPPEPVWKQVGTFAPFWGSTAVPFPKGASNWRRIEARTPEALAISQLKGLKLMLWAVMLAVGFVGFQRAAHQGLGVLSMNDTLLALARGAPLGTGASWAVILCDFLERLFEITIGGHVIIACCRMAGFAALRNTHRPFAARNVADFWNRYNYYFKELAVEFFYYPTFLRYFKRRPRLRRIFAVFATACFGNLYYHFVRESRWIEKLGFFEALRAMDVYAVQCILLAVAISVSQARRTGPQGKGWLRARALPLATVVISYCLMFAFVDEEFVFPMRVHLRFFARLLGIPA
ncbi:MAG TPA: hypothetical protein VI456_10045 [Polyangia bacterium]